MGLQKSAEAVLGPRAGLKGRTCSRRKGLRIRCHGGAATPFLVYTGPTFVLQG